jgi:alpha-1,2-mannosyltransferase
VFALTYRLMKSNRLLAAGLMAGLLSFKPTLLIGLILWGVFDLRRLWPCALGVLISTAILCCGSWLIIPDAWQAFLESLKSNAAFDQMDWWKNLSPRAFWRLLLGPTVAAEGLSMITALAIVIGFGLVCRRTRSIDIRFALSIVVMLGVSPHVMMYEWLLLLIPGLIAITTQPLKIERWRMVIAAMFIVSLVGPPLTQVQLQYYPVAIHLVVPVAGWIAWLFTKWLVRDPTPLEATTLDLHNG